MTQKAGADISLKVGKLLKYREGQADRKKSTSQPKEEKKASSAKK